MKHAFKKNLENIADILLKQFPHVYNNQRLYYNVWKDKNGAVFLKKPRSFNAKACLVGHLNEIHKNMTPKEQNGSIEQIIGIMAQRSFTIYKKMGLFRPSKKERFKLWLLRASEKIKKQVAIFWVKISKVMKGACLWKKN